jgi:hypothetical protein
MATLKGDCSDFESNESLECSDIFFGAPQFTVAHMHMLRFTAGYSFKPNLLVHNQLYTVFHPIKDSNLFNCSDSSAPTQSILA